MPVKRFDLGKEIHSEKLMVICFTLEGDFGAICPECEAALLLTQEQAANGRAQCFGKVALVSG